MYYVYVLRSDKDEEFYTGCTNDLKQRMIMHNEGKVPAAIHRRPLRLIYAELLLNKKDAFRKEQWLKTG